MIARSSFFFQLPFAGTAEKLEFVCVERLAKECSIPPGSPRNFGIRINLYNVRRLASIFNASSEAMPSKMVARSLIGS